MEALAEVIRTKEAEEAAKKYKEKKVRDASDAEKAEAMGLGEGEDPTDAIAKAVEANVGEGAEAE